MRTAFKCCCQTPRRADTSRSEGLKLWSCEGEWGQCTVREFEVQYITYRSWTGFMCLAYEKRYSSCIIYPKSNSENEICTISKTAHEFNAFVFSTSFHTVENNILTSVYKKV
jgi:hypothetical protein